MRYESDLEAISNEKYENKDSETKVRVRIPEEEEGRFHFEEIIDSDVVDL